MRRAPAPLVLAVLTIVACLMAPAGSAVGASVGPAVGADRGDDTCGPGLRLVAGKLCTHGGDQVPPTVAERAALPPRTVARSGVLCAGNGRSGRRVRVLYAYPTDTVSRASMYRSWIRASVALADANLDAATPRQPGQHLRMYCEDGRKVTVTSVAVAAIGDDATFTFGDAITSLAGQVGLGLGDVDHDTPRYTYVLFVDNVTCCYGPAGQGTIYYDDRPDPAQNLNNVTATGPRFAMVEIGGSPFTGAYVFLHEVGHTIGAVQHAAPHASRAGHCFTSADVMCYADGGPYFDDGGSMVAVCPSMPDGQYAFDCEGGDYYEVDPRGSSYLDTHWNTADSGWFTSPA